jgi:N-formylglutamate amidohydrolase
VLTASIICLLFIIVPGVPAAAQAPDELPMSWSGNLPIILSAPHGGREPVSGAAVRRGIGVAQFTTGRDNNTDELTHKLAAKLEQRFGVRPFMIVALFERRYVDVNRTAKAAYESERGRVYYDAYHRLLRASTARVLGDWGRGLLLDIHGQAAQGEFIYRGTNNGRTITSLMRRFGGDALTGPKSIFGQLERMGYSVAPAGHVGERETRYTGGHIVQTYGSHRSEGIDAIQLELGARLRSRANLDKTAADLARAISAFAHEFLPISRQSSAAHSAPVHDGT